MRKIVFAAILLCSFAFVYAQPRGQMPPGGGMGEGNRPPGGTPRQMQQGSSDKVWIENLPEIPGLTLEQKLDLGNILSKQYQDVGKQMEKKMAILQVSGNPEQLSVKQSETQQKKLEKIDKKIEKITQKYDKKVRKLLTEEQYRVYLEKKQDARFRSQRSFEGESQNGEKMRPPMGGNHPSPQN